MRGQRKVVVAEEYLFVEIHSLESSGAIRTRCRELVVNGYDPRSVPNQWHRLWKITWNKTCHFVVGVSTRHLHSYVRKYPAHGLVRKYTALSHMCKFDLLHLSVNLDYAVSYVNSLGAGAVFSTLKHNWRGKKYLKLFSAQSLLTVHIICWHRENRSSFSTHLPTGTNSFFVTLFLQFPLLILGQFRRLLWWFWRIWPSATRCMLSAFFILRFPSFLGYCAETLCKWK